MVANTEGTTPGAGWFADPAGSPYLRWWDGSQWTDNFIDAKTGAPPGELPAAPSAPAASTTPEVVAVQPEAEPVQAEPVQAEPVQAEPVQAEPVQAEPVQAEPVQAEPAQAEPAQAAPDSAFAPGSPFAPMIPGAYVPEPVIPVVPAMEPAAPPSFDSVTSAESVPEPVAFDPGPSFPEQTTPPGPQLTRRQARIMQEMEEARGNAGTASVDAEAPASPDVPIPVAADPQAVAIPAAVQPPIVQPPIVQPAVVQPPVVEPPAVQPPSIQSLVAPVAETPAHTPIVPPPTPSPAVQTPAAQEPVVVPLATPPTPYDATTVAPPSVAAPTPAAWPFAATPDTTTAVPLAAADSATPWLNAPAPSPDAVLPVEQTAYEPMARPRSQSGTAQEVFVGSTNNWAIWVFAALPILHLAIIWYVYTTVEPAFDSPIRWGVLLGPIVFYILLAAVDLSILKRNGHVNLPSVLLAIIPLLYLGIRSARLGVRTLPPLVVWVVLQAAAVVALMFVFPTIFAQLTSATDPSPTPTSAPAFVTDQAFGLSGSETVGSSTSA